MNITFNKYQGTGNDFIIIDDRNVVFPVHDTDLVARLCDRRFGIGADGLILLQPHQTSSYFMKYYNSDGKESSMCGNGGRCIAAFALKHQVVSGKHRFMAIDGLHDAEPITIDNQTLIRLKMQDVNTIESRPNNAYTLNTGSPHFIQFIAEPVSSINLVEQAKQIRYNNEFKLQGINVNFINVINSHEIVIRTYERGVEDETFSCGTGVTAAAIGTAFFNQFQEGEHTVNVKTPGGALSVEYTYSQEPNNQCFKNIYLQGPASFVFEGVIEI